jgi:hypothetical protein
LHPFPSIEGNFMPNLFFIRQKGNINTTSFENGIYMLSLESAEGTAMKKVVVMK